MERFNESPRTTLSRAPHMGSFERDTIYQILDEALFCHVGFVHNGKPVVLPTIHGRADDVLYLHGSPAGRLIRTLQTGVDLAISVALLDGLVLARSLFHSSMHYRSVAIFGSARPTEGPEKLHGLKVITDHTLPGRWEHARRPSEKELRATTVLAVPIEEVSAKISTGPPNDEEEDHRLGVWAGVVPLRLIAGPPEPDPRLDGIEVPDHVRDLLKRHGGD